MSRLLVFCALALLVSLAVARAEPVEEFVCGADSQLEQDIDRFVRARTRQYLGHMYSWYGCRIKAPAMSRMRCPAGWRRELLSPYAYRCTRAPKPLRVNAQRRAKRACAGRAKLVDVAQLRADVYGRSEVVGLLATCQAPGGASPEDGCRSPWTMSGAGDGLYSCHLAGSFSEQELSEPKTGACGPAGPGSYVRFPERSPFRRQHAEENPRRPYTYTCAHRWKTVLFQSICVTPGFKYHELAIAPNGDAMSICVRERAQAPDLAKEDR